MRAAVCTGVRICNQMPDTTRPMAKPASPVVTPPTNVAMRKIVSVKPSMAAPNGTDQRLDGENNLTGRLFTPSDEHSSGIQKENAPVLAGAFAFIRCDQPRLA